MVLPGRTMVPRILRSVPRRRRRRWGPLVIALRSAQIAFVVVAESLHQIRHVSRRKESVANRRHTQVPDQGIGVCKCLFDTAAISAAGDIQLRGNLLTRQYD